MRIVLCYTHHPRCIAHYHRRAFTMLGHDVVTVGPWAQEYSLGTRGREPSICLPRRQPPHYHFADIGVNLGPDDLFILIDSGEDLQITDVPGHWVHLALEGAHLEWSSAPFKCAGLMQHVVDRTGVHWLPGGFDIKEHLPGPPLANREYDLVQIATPRQTRQILWQIIPALAPDLCCLFGEMWGSLYSITHQLSLATFVTSGQDFVTMRVFEAMAMGTLVIADRTPSLSRLFGDDCFIGYEPISKWRLQGKDYIIGDEPFPDPDWLVSVVRRYRRDGDYGLARRAYEQVWEHHSWCKRVQAILDLVKNGNCGQPWCEVCV